MVLDRLAPAERLAFVLHDLFAISFDEIALILERSEAATRQLASRARRRVQGAEMACQTDVLRSREVVTAFLAASRDGDFDAQLGCEMNARGAIITDEFGRTSVPGVYAAGDASIVIPAQLVIAAAGGSRAAAGVNMDLTDRAFLS